MESQVDSILGMEREVKDTLNSSPVIEAKNLELVFQTGDGPAHALKDVNLTVNRALSTWKDLTAPRPVTRSGVWPTGV